jgi:hypothetical protein
MKTNQIIAVVEVTLKTERKNVARVYRNYTKINPFQTTLMGEKWKGNTNIE